MSETLRTESKLVPGAETANIDFQFDDGPDPAAHDNSTAALCDWLAAEATTRSLRWLLAMSDDGVNWGYVQDNQLLLSHDDFPVYSPPLRVITLQQVRLFGEGGELFIWRTGSGFAGRFLGDADDQQHIDETYLLWGTQREGLGEHGFTLLAEQDGMRHAPPPCELTFDPQSQRLALRVRHVIDFDGDGQARVAASRLCGFEVAERYPDRSPCKEEEA